MDVFGNEVRKALELKRRNLHGSPFFLGNLETIKGVCAKYELTLKDLGIELDHSVAANRQFLISVARSDLRYLRTRASSEMPGSEWLIATKIHQLALHGDVSLEEIGTSGLELDRFPRPHSFNEDGQAKGWLSSPSKRDSRTIPISVDPVEFQSPEVSDAPISFISLFFLSPLGLPSGDLL